LDLTTGMTVEAWVNPVATEGWRTVLMKERTTDLAYALYGSGPDKPAGFVATGSSGYGKAGAPPPPPPASWSPFATTYDGATVRVYINGVQVVSAARTKAIKTSTGDLRIGGNAIWGEFFQGLIDEVRIYDRALSASEVQTDMTTPIGDSSSTGPPPD